MALDISLLVTFIPTPFRPFKAHPLTLIKKQAQSMGIEHVSLNIREADAFEDYIQAINTLDHQYGIADLITGDIDFINHQPNWIKSCCEKTNIISYCPLWQRPRSTFN